MSAELDMSQYIDLFLQEADEQLEILETETLALEQDPADERLQVIFRAAHTLKGSSRAMGFSNFAELTHEMENVLDQLRNHTLKVTTSIADRILACIDTLAQMVEQIRSGQGDNVECALLVNQLKEVNGGEPTDTAPTNAAPCGEEKVSTTHIDPEVFDALDEAALVSPVYHATFKLAEDCVMKFVRAFMAVSIVEESGELLATYPTMEKLEDEDFELDFELVFQSTCEIQDVQSKVGQISELASFEIKPWSRPTEQEVAEEPVADRLPPTEPQETAAPQADEVNLVANPASPVPTASNAPQKTKTESNQTVRVDVARLDNLMNLVGELVIDRTRIAQIGNDLSARFQDPNIDALTETVSHIARITGDLQDQIMKARMMPVDTVFNRFPRVVRDLANKLGKDVKLDITGGDTELDRSVIEVIGDPLLHILRNSVDHGLESTEGRIAAGKPAQGQIQVNARHQENHIVIEIIDDGKGIDAERVKAKAVQQGLITQDVADKMSDKEAVQLIFHSGLSTAAQVSEVSGRGVGMDIVRSNIQKLGGIIDLESIVGVGTRFALRLPLTLAIIRGLLVDVQERVYVLPLSSVVETLLIKAEDIQQVNHKEVVVIRGMSTPIKRMRVEYIEDAGREPQSLDEYYTVIVGAAEQRLGLVVDKLIGEHEVVIKSLSRFCGDVRGVTGATILGDGKVALIADVNGLIETDRGLR